MIHYSYLPGGRHYEEVRAEHMRAQDAVRAGAVEDHTSEVQEDPIIVANRRLVESRRGHHPVGEAHSGDRLAATPTALDEEGAL